MSDFEKPTETPEPTQPVRPPQLALDDQRRVKVLSPGMLVAKRFFRNKLALIGLVILIAMWNGARQGRYRPGDMNGLETGAAYWHMVDLVWLILFPLVYVIH